MSDGTRRPHGAPEDPRAAIATTRARVHPIPPSLLLSYAQRQPRAEPVFLLFSEPAAGGGRAMGRLSFLQEMLHDTPETSCLALTADLFVAAHSPAAERQARGEDPGVMYGRTVMSVRNALGDREKRLDDETIVAVWLLILCEVGCTPPFTNLPPSALKPYSPRPFPAHRHR